MRGSSVMRYLGASAVIASLLLVALAGAATSRAAEACVAPGAGPNVCVRVSHEPATPSVSTADRQRFVSVDATVANDGGSSVNHATLAIGPIDPQLGEGFSFVEEPTPSAGSCSYSAATRTISCELGQLRSGGSVDVALTLRTPTVAGIQNLRFASTFDEGPTDQNPNPGKTDTVEATEAIEVIAASGTDATFVPAGTGFELSIAQNGHRDSVDLPPQAFDTTAKLEFTSTSDLPFTCPAKQVCRLGTPWLTATIPGTFDPLAEFDFFWPANQVSTKQTVKNFVLFYLVQPGGPVQIIDTRCSASLDVVPCLKDIVMPKSGPLKGSLSATLVTDHNGHMR